MPTHSTYSKIRILSIQIEEQQEVIIRMGKS